MPSLDELNCRMFRDSLHSDFTVLRESGESVTLTLVEVHEKLDAPALEQFSLTFRGPGTTALDQRIHRFEHPAFGSLDLFIVPLGPDQEAMLYEVIFNRIRSKK